MTFWQAIILSLIQGVGEFLPISSSGHLVLARWWMELEVPAAIDVVLHLATVVSILIVLRKDVWQIIWHPRKYWVKIGITMIPAGIAGLLISDFREEYLTGAPTIATMLIIVGIALAWVMRTYRAKKQKDSALVKSIDDLSYSQALLIGVAQVLALIPGTSRSGITVLAGILGGLELKWAVRYSFLSGLPLIAVAGLYGGYELVQDSNAHLEWGPIVLAFGLTTVVGVVALRLLTGRKVEQVFTYSAYYRILLGAILFILALNGV